MLHAVLEDARSHTGGELASYIPELARADPDGLGVALVSTHGSVHEAGDSETEFTIQSVSNRSCSRSPSSSRASPRSPAM